MTQNSQSPKLKAVCAKNSLKKGFAHMAKNVSLLTAHKS